MHEISIIGGKQQQKITRYGSIYYGGTGSFYHIMVPASRKLYAGKILETLCFYYLMESNRKSHFKCVFNGTAGFAKAICIDSLP